jgi:hypothetical protein
MPCHAGNATHPHIFHGINDIYASVRSVREIIPLCPWICPGNVRTGDGFARNRDRTENADGRISVVVLIVIVTLIVTITGLCANGYAQNKR